MTISARASGALSADLRTTLPYARRRRSILLEQIRTLAPPTNMETVEIIPLEELPEDVSIVSEAGSALIPAVAASGYGASSTTTYGGLQADLGVDYHFGKSNIAPYIGAGVLPRLRICHPLPELQRLTGFSPDPIIRRAA